jgi:hypothetical protein
MAANARRCPLAHLHQRLPWRLPGCGGRLCYFKLVIGRPGSPLAAQSGWTIGNNVRIDIRWATSNAAETRRHADWWCSLQMSSSERPTCEREPIHCESEHRIPLQS